MKTQGRNSHGHETTETKQPSNDAYIAVNADLQSGQKAASDVRASAADWFSEVNRPPRANRLQEDPQELLK